MIDLKGRSAVVTGSARGIGKAIATKLASFGANVVISDINADAAKATAAEIGATGPKAISFAADVSKGDQADALIESCVKEFGKIDILVNNAGITKDTLLLRMKQEQWDAVIAVNLTGTYLCAQAAFKHMFKQKNGAIINISSIAGENGNVGQTNYAAAKAAIAAMTIVNAMELERYGVTANCIAPVARTRLTLQTPGMGQMMENPIFDPDNISPLVAVLASADCRFNGQVFSVYGGAVGIYAGWSIAEEVVADGGAVHGKWNVEQLTAAMAHLPAKVQVNDQMSAVMKSSASA